MTSRARASSVELVALLGSASVEISSDGHQLTELAGHFPAGTTVTITFLPGDNYHRNVATAAALRRAGYDPVPHIAAREMPSRTALDDFLARLRGEAAVKRVLLIAGDVLAARGPFKSSRDVAVDGLLQRHGIAQLGIAGHPEGHPYLDEAESLSSLQAWQRWASDTGVTVAIVSQFCFESGPILNWLAALDARGLALPVTIGLAGPATLATLSKFALRCGIGHSMRALRGHIGRYGRLLADNGPDDVLNGLAAAPAQATAAIAGFHVFPFGGLRKAAKWLRAYPEERPALKQDITSTPAAHQKP